MRFVNCVRPLRRLVPALVAGALLAASATAARAADAENPDYKAWAAYKPGAAAVHHTVVNSAAGKQEMDTTTKLVELTADKAVIEVSIAMNINGQAMTLPGTKKEIPAKAPAAAPAPDKPAAPDAKPDAKTTEETVEAGGKSYKCKVTEASADLPNGLGKTTAKIWSSPDVPGGMVKMTSQTNGTVKAETTMTLVSFTTGK